MTVPPVTLTIAYFYWLRALFAPPPPSAVRRPPRGILTHRSPSLIGYTCCHFQNISFLLATTSLYTTSHFPIQSPGAISRSFFSIADWPSGLSLYQSFITIGWERSLRRLPPHLPRSVMAGSIPHDAAGSSGLFLSRSWAGSVPNPLGGGLGGSDALSQPFNVD